jgi:hypothetical protein
MSARAFVSRRPPAARPTLRSIAQHGCCPLSFLACFTRKASLLTSLVCPSRAPTLTRFTRPEPYGPAKP